MRYLIDGFSEGFDLGYSGVRKKYSKGSPESKITYWQQDGIVEQSHERSQTGEVCWTVFDTPPLIIIFSHP